MDILDEMGVDGKLTVETTAHTYRSTLQLISKTVGIAVKTLKDRCFKACGALEYKALMHHRDYIHVSRAR